MAEKQTVKTDTHNKPTKLPQQQSMLSKFWTGMIHNIIHPLDLGYRPQNLGSTDKLLYKSKQYTKQDHTANHGDRPLDITIYTRANDQKYVIVYLHRNAFNKMEAFQLLEALPEEIGLACFDFIGSGLNKKQEDKASMGLREAEQARTVVDFLKGLGYRVAVWGRSMGASAALLYGQSQIIIADSPYFSFKQATRKVSSLLVPCPLKPLICCLFPCIYSKMRADLLKQGYFDTAELDMMKAVVRIPEDTMLVLVSGEKDELISPGCLRKIWGKFAGKDKEILFFEGKHDTVRPRFLLDKVMGIVKKRFTEANNAKNQSNIMCPVDSQVKILGNGDNL